MKQKINIDRLMGDLYYLLGDNPAYSNLHKIMRMALQKQGLGVCCRDIVYLPAISTIDNGQLTMDNDGANGDEPESWRCGGAKPDADATGTVASTKVEWLKKRAAGKTSCDTVPKWEYEIQLVKLKDKMELGTWLDEMGNMGWELVSYEVSNGLQQLIFKRLKIEGNGED